MADAFEVVNSVGHGAGQYDAQKVLFQRKALLRASLRKSIFNGGEVQYLTVLHGGMFGSSTHSGQFPATNY